MKRWIQKHGFLVLITLLSALLLFPNLDNRTIVGDEAYTVLQAKTVLEHGYPHAFYKNFELLPKATYYLGSTPLFNWTPWLESYLTAGMLALFGMSEFWLRLPFALIALATVVLFYFFIRKLSNDHFIICTSTLLLATSVTFLLHARQARWYSLAAFFALATWYTYWLWLREKRSPAWLVASAAFLFHSQIFIFFSVMFSLFVHYTLFERKTKTIKEIATVVIPVIFLTLPWFLLTGQLAGKAGGLAFNPLKIALNFALYGYYTFVLLVPVLIILPLAIVALKNKTAWSDESKFIATIILASFAFLVVKGDILPAIRYLVFLIPLFSIINAHALDWFRKQNTMIAYLLIFFVIVTNYANVAIFLPAKPFLSGMTLGRSATEVQDFINSSLAPRTYFFDYIYELTHDYDSAEEEIIDIMQRNGRPTDIFITSHFPHTLLLYTDMEIGLPNAHVESYYKRLGRQPPSSTPDWIIIRNFKLEKGEIDAFRKKADGLYNLSTYEAKTININDEERWANAPDPINHKFRTDRSGTFTIYHKR